MTTGNQSTADESWAFALRLYAEPEVPESCLALQAEAGVDVMLMLVVLYAVAQQKIALTAADIAAMNTSCRPWREQIVHPLRAIRTTLKSGPAPAPTASTEKLRSQIKAAELAAERLENDFLAASLPSAAARLHDATRQHIEDAIINVVRSNPDITDALIRALHPAITTLVERTLSLGRGQH